MATCVCGQPIADGDKFCTGCGKTVAVATACPAVWPAACPQCGRQATEPASFCSGCGAQMEGGPVFPTPTPRPQPTGFQWKWMLLTIPIVVAITLACSVVAAFVGAAMGYDMDNPATQTAAGVIAVLSGMLLGGITAGWLSPGRTIVEPGAGIAAALIGCNLLSGDVGNILLGWMLPFGIGAGGARIGEWLQGRSSRRQG